MKYIKVLFWAIALAIFVWFCASWADIVAHNTTDCVYQSWNLFVILFGEV